MPAPLFTVITLFVAKAASLAINKAHATVPASTIWGCMPASGGHLLIGGQLFGGCMPAPLFTVITLFVAKAASLAINKAHATVPTSTI